MCLLVQSTRNFLSEVLRAAPPPALLRFDADRATRLELSRRAETLAAELRAVRAELASERAARAAAKARASDGSGGSGAGVGAAAGKQQQQQQQQVAAGEEGREGGVQATATPGTHQGRASSGSSGAAEPSPPQQQQLLQPQQQPPPPQAEPSGVAAGGAAALPRPHHLRGASITLDADAAFFRGDPGEAPLAAPARPEAGSAAPPGPAASAPLPAQLGPAAAAAAATAAGPSAGAALASLLATSPGAGGGIWGDGGPAMAGRSPSRRWPSSLRGSDPATSALDPSGSGAAAAEPMLPANGGAPAAGAAVTLHSPLVGGVSCLAWSPRGDNVASGGRGGLVSIWSAPEAGGRANAARHASLGCGAPVTALSWDARVSG
jgi:hypothetical protein